MITTTMNHQSTAHNASFYERSVPLLNLLIPFLVSSVLLVASNSRAVGSVRLYINDNRTGVSIIVQILSTIMSLLQMTTFTGILSASYRLHLSNHSMSLDTIGLFNALVVPRISWSLPLIGVVATMFTVILSNGPGALWAGALTPITELTHDRIGSIQVPQFTKYSANIWDSEFVMISDNVWNFVDNCTDKRVGDSSYISNCPVPSYQAQLLSSVRDASIGGERGPRNHSKLDTPSWLYQGRSYGVGSTPGLLPPQDIPPSYNLLQYSYIETGYAADVECVRNSSPALHFERREHIDNVDIWAIEGTLPNSIQYEFFPVMAWNRDSLDEADVAAWVGVSNNDVHMFSVVASEQYGNFSNIQCTAHFEPTEFFVGVNISASTIQITPMKGTQDTTDLDQTGTGHLKSNVIRSINLLSRMSTSLYISVLGEALQYNLETLIKSSGDADSLEESIVQATSDSFVAMIDDALGVYGSAQLMLSNDTTQADIQGEFEAIKFGQALYQWAVLGINIALLLSLTVEGFRTRWWYGLPRFDPLDFKSVVAATSTGGMDVARELQTPHNEGEEAWTGDPNNRTLGSIPVQLSRNGFGGGLAVIPYVRQDKYALGLLSDTEDVLNRTNAGL